MERDHFLSTTDDVALPSPAMTWHLPPVPEQSLDCFFNPTYDPIKGQFILEKLPNFGNKVIINPSLPSVSADPGFAERAARFSPFGSRSFNSRNNTEFQQNFNSNQNFGNLKLTRVSSTPSLKSNCLQTQMEIRPINGLLSKFDENGLGRTEFASPNDGSSVSEQIPIGETEEKNFGGLSSRKRKSVSRVKSQKVLDEQNDRDSKRCKSKTSENKGIEKCNGKKEEKDESEDDKSDEADAKAPEPPKDYIHVRARRGQATDSHSLAERVRREKISERMKFLQDLVPGCNKVTGKALMLDEIINYVQSLQRQVEFLSMKLATVDPVDFNTDSLLSNNVNNSTYRVDSSSLFGQQKQDIHQAKTDFLNKQISINCSLDPPDTTIYREISSQLPFVGEFGQGFPQLLGSYDDDLQSIVQMGFGPNPGLHLQTYPDSNDTHARRHMSIEL